MTRHASCRCMFWNLGKGGRCGCEGMIECFWYAVILVWPSKARSNRSTIMSSRAACVWRFYRFVYLLPEHITYVVYFFNTQRRFYTFDIASSVSLAQPKLCFAKTIFLSRLQYGRCTLKKIPFVHVHLHNFC